jgi:hypothetical protein
MQRTFTIKKLLQFLWIDTFENTISFFQFKLRCVFNIFKITFKCPFFNCQYFHNNKGGYKFKHTHSNLEELPESFKLSGS